MIPVRLLLQNFLSYHQQTEIDFSSIHLACISGNNGAGKSTLLDAITWSLFGKARRNDDAVIYGDENACTVAFEFLYEGDLYRVQRTKTRDKTGELDLQLRDPPGERWINLTEKSLRETDHRIQQILRLDYETFINASFLLQGKADQFAQQKPSDRKRILGSILGLDIWEVYREKAVEKRKEAEKQSDLLKVRLLEIKRELDEEDQRRRTLAGLLAELNTLSDQRQDQEKLVDGFRQIEGSVQAQKESLERLKQQVQAQTEEWDEAAARWSAKKSERESFRVLLDRADEIRGRYLSLQECRKQIQAMNLLAIQAGDLERRMGVPRLVLEKEHGRLQQEQRQLASKQTQIAETEVLLEKKKAEKESLTRQISQLQEESSDQVALETVLTQNQQRMADLRSENTRLDAEMKTLERRREQLQSQPGGACPLCGQELTEGHRLNVLADIERQGKEKGDQFRANKKELAELEETQRNLETRKKNALQISIRLQGLHRQVDQLENWIEQNQVIVEHWYHQELNQLTAVKQALEDNSFFAEERSQLSSLQQEYNLLGYDRNQHTALQQKEVNLQSVEKEYIRLEQAGTATDQLDREIASLEVQLERLNEHRKQSQLSLDVSEASYRLASASLQGKVQAEEKLQTLVIKERALHQEIGAARQKVEVLEDLRALQGQLTQEREEIAIQIGRYQSLERALGKDGVPALLIEQALPDIEQEANNILDHLSAGAMSLRFLTQRDYKDKHRDDKKETLDIQISDPEGIRDYEMFSGGEAFRVNFAIRLALSRVLARRSGARLQTLVIDEGFGSQDAAGRQRLVEAIHLVQDDFAMILVITHIEELKDAFPTRIEVEKFPSGSTVRVIT